MFGEMSRILFPTTDFLPKLSGVATVAWGQAAGLARLGHEVRVETLDFGPLPPALEIPQGLEIRAHSIRTRAILRLAPIAQMVRRAIREYHPDCLYSTTYRGLGPVLALMAGKAGLRFALYIHGTELFTENRNPLRRKLMEYTFRRASLLLTNSENTKRLIHEFFPRIQTPVVALHPGIELEKYDSPQVFEQAKELRARWLETCRASKDAVILLTAARVTREKGIHRVMEALASLHKTLPRTVLYIICGSGPDLEALKRLAKELEVDRCTLFEGAISPLQLPARYRAADIYVQPSNFDSFGISLVEAEYCGLPCVATRVGGIPEAVLDGQSALLVPLNDQAALQNALRTVIENDELRARMGEAGRKHAAQFSWDAHAQRLSQLLEAWCIPSLERPAR